MGRRELRTTSSGTGSCSVQMTSNLAGQTIVRASTSVNAGGVVLIRATNEAEAGDSVDAQKNWVNARISISPNRTCNS
jgi:hypothetical protein